MANEKEKPKTWDQYEVLPQHLILAYKTNQEARRAFNAWVRGEFDIWATPERTDG